MAYYLTTAAVFTSWYAWQHWRGRGDGHSRRVLGWLAGVTLIFAVLVGFTGDSSARYLAHGEPTKLAAAEVLLTTQSHAPLRIGGILSGQTLHGAIAIPGLLSLLVGGSTSTVVRGLNAVAPELWPPLFIHYCFDGMVGIGMTLLVLPILYLVWRRRRWALWSLIIAGPLAAIAVELGWMVTELGRQPYAIRGILLTQDAITSSAGVVQAAVVFPCLFVLLLVATILVLRRLPRERA